MAARIEQIQGMGTKFEDPLAICMLVSSIDGLELYPVTASVTTLSNDKVYLEVVPNSLIEDGRAMNWNGSGTLRANSALISCGICVKIHAASKMLSQPTW